MAAQGLYIVKGYVDTDHGQVHYRRCGLGVPSVLLLHSTPGSSIMFVSALKRLAAKGLHAVAVDLPNCGESCRTAEEPKVADLADAVLQAAQALRFSASIDLIGHQSGAIIASYIASELPGAVRRLVLWGVPVLGFMERGDVMREEAPDYEGNLTGVIEEYLEKKYPVAVPWQLKVRSVIDMLQMYERRSWPTKATAAVDATALIKTMEMPILFMAGDAEPYQKQTMKAALQCKNGKYVHLGVAGSDVVDEVPDEYVREVFEFLREGPLAPERASTSRAMHEVTPQGLHPEMENRHNRSESARHSADSGAAAAAVNAAAAAASARNVVPAVAPPPPGAGQPAVAAAGSPKPKPRGSSDLGGEGRRSSSDKKKLMSFFKANKH